MKTIKVVAGVLEREGRVLATQRGYGEFAGGWEFPGGKVEPGEESAAALVRELREELAVEVHVGRHLLTVDHDYTTFRLSMACFLCELAAGEEPQLLEHSAARWLGAAELREVNWLPADVAVIEALLEQAICK